MLRLLLLFEAATFFAAAAVHSGVLVPGYAHHRARIAESVIGTVLFAAALSTWIVPRRVRQIAVAAQAFGIVGVLVGLLTVALGIGPRTGPDLAYHGAILAVLVWGLLRARRKPGTLDLGGHAG